MGKRLSQVQSTLSLMSQRKGTHIGVVLSFVIFITFLIFLYMEVQPTINLDEKKNLLEFVENGIIGKSSADLTSVSLFIDKNNPQNCVELVNFFSNVGVGEKVIVTNDVAKIDQVSKSGNNLLILRNSGDLFFKIYESEEFTAINTGTLGTCQPLNEVNNGYILGLIKTNKQIFETKIIKLINDYYADYELFKEEIGVGLGDEFGFGFTYNNGTVIKTKETNVSVSVYADEIPIQYISDSAALEPGFLSVKVW